MKRIALLAALATAFTATAAWQNVGTLRLAGTTDLVTGVTKIGGFIGNPMLGAMAAGAFAKVRQVQFFGPMRPGAAVTLPLYLDDAVVPGPENGYGLAYALIYPVSRTKAQFLKAHPGSVETNGLIRIVSDDGDDSSDALDIGYVGFSEDGRWAVLGDRSALVSRALAEESLKVAAEPLPGLMGFGVNERGMSAVRRGLAALEKQLADKLAEGDADDEDVQKGRKTLADLRRAACVLNGLSAFRCAAGVDDSGLVFRGEAVTLPGTELGKTGLKPLAADAFAGVAADAFAACVNAADSGSGRRTFAETWRLFAGAMKKAGFDLAPFFALVEKPGLASLTLDVPAVMGLVTNQTALADLDFDEDIFKKEIAPLMGEPFVAASSAEAVDFRLKGCKIQVSPSVRFAATLPEAKDRKVFSASVCSLYAVCRAYAPACAALFATGGQKAIVDPLVAALPPEGKCGIASAAWREGDSVKGLLRVSADEIRGFAALCNIAVAVEAAGGGCGDCDDSDDADDDAD